jgi:multiple sugar transport system substrate-binding protein
MTSLLRRRSVLKLGGGLLAAAALAPHQAFSQGTALSYWHTFTSQSEFAGLDDILALFAKAHPDIAVNPEAIPNPEFMAKITAAVVSGSRPNVTALSSERFQDLRAMGALLDLTDRIASWERRADFDDARFDSITHEGRLYGVPAFSFVDWIYYRKDWFDEAGIATPTTLAEFRDAAIKLTDASAGRYGFGLRGGPGGQDIVVNMMEAFGASLMHEDGSISLDRETAIAGIDFWAGLMFRDKAVPPSAPNDGFRQIIEGFQTGQTAMVYHHTGSFQDIASKLEPGVQFGTIPIPTGPAKRVARLAYAYHAITNEDQVDASWEWAKFWGEPDAAVAFLGKTGYFPASSVAAKDERIASNPLYASASATLEFGIRRPSFPGYAGWAEGTVLPAFQRVLIGEATPEQAVDEIIAGLTEAIS